MIFSFWFSYLFGLFFYTNIIVESISSAASCNSSTFTSIPFSTIPGNYPMSIRWNVVDNTGLCLQAKIEPSDTTSVKWFTIGFAASSSMVNSPKTNCYLIRRTSSSSGSFHSYVIESYDSILVEQPEDIIYEVVDYQLLSTGMMTFTLYRPLISTKSTELTLNNQMQTLLWSYGIGWPIRGHGDGDKGSAMLNVYQPSAGGTLQTNSHTTEWYNLLIIYAWILILCLILSIIHLETIRESSFARFFLQRHLGKPIRPSLFHMFTLDFIRAFAILKFGELCIILFYIALHVIVAVLSISNLNTTVTDTNQQLGFVFGYLAALNLLLLLLPIVRIKILWETMCHMSYDRVIKFHRWVGRLFLVFSIIHGILTADRCDPSVFDSNECGNAEVIKIFGSLAVISTILLAILSLEPIRRRAYEIFIYPHRTIACCIVVLSILHAPFFMGLLLVIPLVLFIITTGIKTKNLFFDKCIVQRVSQEGDGTFLELAPSKRVKTCAKKMTASSYFLLRIPNVALFEWHPITGILSPNLETIAFVVKPLEGKNAWSRNLYEYITKCHLNPKEIGFYLSGPYGLPSINITSYNVLVLVAGGIGITPMIHCINYIRNKNPQELGILTRVLLIWTVQHPDHLLCCHDYLFNESLGEKVDSASLQEEGKIRALGNITDNNAYQTMNTPSVQETVNSLSISIDIKLYVTRASSDGNIPLPNGLAVSYEKGRPPLDIYITPTAYKKDEKVGVMVCGPPALADDTQKYAMDAKFDCHREEFEF